MLTKLIRHDFRRVALVVIACCVALPSMGQTCYTADDMDASTQTAIQNAAQQYLGLTQQGNYAGLRAAAIPGVASNFTPIANAIGAQQKDLQGQATSNGVYELDASTATGPIASAEFYCGIFNSPNRVGFIIPNLPPGKYAFASYTVNGQKPVNINFILQQNGGQWQLAGLTIEPRTVAGHDSTWFLTQARAYHQNGANLTAYLYYWMAWKLAAPAEIEYTATRDQIADEMQKSKPANWPTAQNPMTLSGGGKTFRVTALFPDQVGNDLDVVVKYQAVSDISNTAAAFADNTSVIKSLLMQYQDMRQAFNGVVARAVAPNGNDYGTMLAMKDVK